MNYKLARTLRVLIVDDQILAKGYLKYSLEELGFESIDYVSSASEALSAIRKERFDLIVCGYDLKQEQEGYYLYAQLLETDELPPSTAFVFISADTSTDIVHSIVELQPDEFLAKPFSVKELDKRLFRVLKRKQALKPIYTLIEQKAMDAALLEVEKFLTEPKNAEFFPVALKIKGELLLACRRYEQARDFYQAIINVQKFTWAQLGLVRSYIQLNEDEEAEKLILTLAFRQDSMLAAYDLFAALKIKLQEFEDALESVTVAGEISPRNIHRHQRAMDLSRLTHNYESQFEAAKKIVRFAKNSIHDKPEIYLNVARAGIDYAMSADESETQALIKQSKEYLRQLHANFPKAEVEQQIKVIDARLLYLQDETENARALLDQMNDDNWKQQNIDALIDLAKAFHEVGLQDHALRILDTVEQRCEEDPSQSEIFLRFVRQERSEKSSIPVGPKALNNRAVTHYQQGELAEALKTFRLAFTVMPRNPSIALNLLQATAMDLKDTAAAPEYDQRLIHNCIRTIEAGQLNPEQEQRYQRIKSVLKELS